ncbi:Cytidylate kinase [Lachnospiraceae bacterium TWA4]|nr:Cytidylate kinase [Lachnospiraceae bacterium TWA4]
MSYNVAIDGPAGAGKSTIAKLFAKEMGFIYVDTGAMYRAMGLYFHGKGITPQDIDKIKEGCKTVDVSISYENGKQLVWLNGEDVSKKIRTEEIGGLASSYAVVPQIREKLVELQQKLATTADIVMDGRDIGTVVLPNADLKVYLTASVKERAKRRYKELIDKGMQVTIEEIEEDIRGRDYRDMNREVSPLKQADDAVVLDTSFMNIEEAAKALKELFEQRKDA